MEKWLSLWNTPTGQQDNGRGSVENAWSEICGIDAEIVSDAAAHFQSARGFFWIQFNKQLFADSIYDIYVDCSSNLKLGGFDYEDNYNEAV